jgi:uncharacterized protein with GYD domain
MAKFLIEGNYKPEGLRGLHKDKASGRREAISKAVQALGGKLESLHYCFGERDAIAIVEMPDNVAMSALALAINGSGTLTAKTTPLLTVEETDQALAKKTDYRAPGT